MSTRDEVREFLTSRRAKVTPEQAGITATGQRRVKGLRRSEVAMLADVSVEYYATIERGNIAGVSDTVLEAIARALMLDDAEREHLFDLARAANGAADPVRRRQPTTWQPRESLLRALDSVTAGPAFVRNGRMDILATNLMGRAFFDHVFHGPGRGNLARFNFLDERSHAFIPTGIWRQILPCRFFGRKPDAIRTINSSMTSLASCLPAAMNSVSAGVHITSADTAAVLRIFTITPSEI